MSTAPRAERLPLLIGWRPLLRIARRDVLRHRWVSLLVVLLVALPITGLSAVAITTRSSALAPDERAERQLGTADAVLTWISQSGTGHQQDVPDVGVTSGAPPTPPITDDPAGLLPAGSRAVPVSTVSGVLTSRSGADAVVVVGMDASDDLTSGLLRVVHGRLATGPGEVAVTRAVAASQHLRVGDRVDLEATTPAGPGAKAARSSVRVVGVAVPPSAIDDLAVQVVPGTVAGSAVNWLRWLVRLPAGTAPESLVNDLGPRGISVLTREEAGRSQGRVRDESFAEVGAVAAALALLEVVLLSAAAFTVTARRSQRQLALLSVVGGDASDLRRTVLAGGGLLGLAGGLLGAVAGPAAAVALRPLLEARDQSLYGAWEVPWLWLAGVVALGIGSGVLAALGPARAATRLSPARALVENDVPGQQPGRLWLASPLLAIPGAGLLVLARGDFRPNYALLGAGAVLVVLGATCLLPALVAGGGALARWWPPTVRVALRDNARHPARTAAAAAAVLAVVASGAALAIYLASSDAYQRSQHQPVLTDGQLSIQLNRSPSGTGEADQALDQLRSVLPADAISWLAPVGGCTDRTPCTSETLALAPPCQRPEECPPLLPGTGQLVGAAPETVAALFGDAAPRAQAALDAGRVVVRDPALAPAGAVTVVTTYAPESGRGEVARATRATVPATVVSTATASRLPAGVVPPGALLASGLALQPPTQILAATNRRPTATELARAQRVVDAHGGGELLIERGYRSAVATPLALLTLTAGSTALGALTITVALTVGESRQQSVTLATIGASPAGRRRIAGAQAAAVGLLGGAVGLLIGAGVGAAVVTGRAAWAVAVPWPLIGGLALALPLVAGGIAAAMPLATTAGRLYREPTRGLR